MKRVKIKDKVFLELLEQYDELIDQTDDKENYS